MQQLTAEEFAHRVGQTFNARCSDGSFRLELTNLELRPPIPGREGRIPFSLFFTGVDGQTGPQGIYTFEDAAMGELEIFLVPIGQTPDGSGLYQAVFS